MQIKHLFALDMNFWRKIGHYETQSGIGDTSAKPYAEEESDMVFATRFIRMRGLYDVIHTYVKEKIKAFLKDASCFIYPAYGV